MHVRARRVADQLADDCRASTDGGHRRGRVTRFLHGKPDRSRAATDARSRATAPPLLAHLIQSGRWQHPGDDILHEVIPWFEDPLTFLTSTRAGSPACYAIRWRLPSARPRSAFAECCCAATAAKSALRRPAFRARSVVDFEAPLAAAPVHVAPQPGTTSLIRTWMSWLPIATEPLNNLLWALRGDLDHGPHRVG
jgi:hypothetical protein